MPKYLLDTNACVSLRNSLRGFQSSDAERQARHERLIARLRATPASELALSFVVLGELLVWVKKHADPARAAELTRSLTERVPVLGCPPPMATTPASPARAGGASAHPLAHHYADIRATLEARGEGIEDNDLWIAAHARALGMTVVTNNTSHFARVPGLAVEDWTT